MSLNKTQTQTPLLYKCVYVCVRERERVFFCFVFSFFDYFPIIFSDCTEWKTFCCLWSSNTKGKCPLFNY